MIDKETGTVIDKRVTLKMVEPLRNEMVRLFYRPPCAWAALDAWEQRFMEGMIFAVNDRLRAGSVTMTLTIRQWQKLCEALTTASLWCERECGLAWPARQRP